MGARQDDQHAWGIEGQPDLRLCRPVGCADRPARVKVDAADGPAQPAAVSAHVGHREQRQPGSRGQIQFQMPGGQKHQVARPQQQHPPPGMAHQRREHRQSMIKARPGKSQPQNEGRLNMAQRLVEIGRFLFGDAKQPVRAQPCLRGRRNRIEIPDHRLGFGAQPQQPVGPPVGGHKAWRTRKRPAQQCRAERRPPGQCNPGVRRQDCAVHARICAAARAKGNCHRRAGLAQNGGFGAEGAMTKKKKDKAKADSAGAASESRARPRSLTVSYGAFSCTLEGYDNPIEIVAALSERFRAIAAAEPRFALAPPPLDIDMLRQIAEAELRRQVEAGVIDAATIVDLARADGPAPRQRPEPDDAELAEAHEAHEPHGPREGHEPDQASAGASDGRDSPAQPAKDDLRRSRRAEVIARLRAAVEQAAAEHRRSAASRAADGRPPERAPERAPERTPERTTTNAPEHPPERSWPSAGASEATIAAAGGQPVSEGLPPLRLGPDLRIDPQANASGAAPARLPAAPSAQLRAYPPFASARSMGARMLATARYLTEVEGRLGFDAAHAVALMHVNCPGADASACRVAFDAVLAGGGLSRLEGGRFALSPAGAAAAADPAPALG
jgi:hypothetical protein